MDFCPFPEPAAFARPAAFAGADLRSSAEHLRAALRRPYSQFSLDLKWLVLK
jgi:hypothetical protein